jgi:hypothetical protein
MAFAISAHSILLTRFVLHLLQDGPADGTLVAFDVSPKRLMWLASTSD